MTTVDIDPEPTRECGTKLRSVGAEVRTYLDGVQGALKQAGTGNKGFAAMTSYNEVIAELHKTTAALGDKTAATGGAIGAAADAHRQNEGATQKAFTTAPVPIAAF